jgi:hypothetical protein
VAGSAATAMGSESCGTPNNCFNAVVALDVKFMGKSMTSRVQEVVSRPHCESKRDTTTGSKDPFHGKRPFLPFLPLLCSKALAFAAALFPMPSPCLCPSAVPSGVVISAILMTSKGHTRGKKLSRWEISLAPFSLRSHGK